MTIRIVVDTMGSDAFPQPDIEGALAAARLYPNLHLILVGDETLIKSALAKYPTDGLALEVLHSPEHVTMHDQAAQVGRIKPQSSMHIGSRWVKEGRAEAFVTAGNTGAALAITTLHTLKRIPGIKRPALAAIIPLPLHHKKLVMLDIGANAECQPEWLLQFATMGSLYAQHILGVASPRVGLLSNGEEEEKGTPVTREGHALLKVSGLNFIGNVEPKDVLRQGAVDVMVCDGFSGNVFMKTVEAVGVGMGDLIRRELYESWRIKIGGMLARPAFRRIAKQMDPFEVGGTLLLGVDGVVIIAHGRTNALGIQNSIRMAKEAVENKLIDIIKGGIRPKPD
jgi:glycerol-3-phosphate acyltransferase PlsX